MNIVKKAFCRTYQFAFHLALPILPYREPKVYEAIDGIREIMETEQIKSVLLVTDKVLRENGITEGLEKILREMHVNCAVYDETKPNPTVHNVEEAFQIYQAQNCEALIAFGGGSSMDCAKAVGARAAYPKKSLDQLKGMLRVHRKIPTLVAIPTTAGTGSEVTVTAVITDSETRHKYTMNNFTLIPSYAILDPTVTYTLPPALTATTGMDALTHAVEAFIGGSTSKETRQLSLEAVKLIFENIETAYHDGKNAAARKNMLTAAYKAGVAFSKSYVGYIHGVAHSLGGQYNIAHGLANSVLMPIVLEDYGKTIYKKLYTLGIAAGVVSEADTCEDGAKKFIAAIRTLNKNMSIPECLPGIQKEDIPKMARHAAREANPLYPVPKLMDAKELEKFYVMVGE
ncbi:MAG: iron-containing alcohol dehydrogenase [Lachnospiraceae bacterium]|nr:iron-containing alcohol dehydrogenase [Lachnospiraceae bacterium]